MKNKRSPLFIVFFTVFLDLLGFGILIPLLPFVVLHFEATAVEGAFLMALYSICQFIFAPLWGRLSDRIGRRPIILISLVGSTLGYVLFGLANSLFLLFVSRIVSGIAAANISTAQAIVGDCLPPEKRTKGMGIVGAAIGLGFTIGPGLAGIVGLEHGYGLPFFIAAALSATDLVLAWFLLPETYHLRQEKQVSRRRFSFDLLRQAVKVPYIPRLLFVSLCYYTAFSAMEITFGFYIEEVFSLTERHNGYIMFMIGIIIVIVQGGLVGRMARILGDRQVLMLGVVGVLTGLIFIGSVNTVPLLVLSVMLMAFASGFYLPTMTSLISQLSAQEVQGGILGLNQSMASLGRIGGPLLGAYFYETWMPRAPFWVGGILVTLALLTVIPLLFKSPSTVER